jgi:GTPase
MPESRFPVSPLSTRPFSEREPQAWDDALPEQEGLGQESQEAGPDREDRPPQAVGLSLAELPGLLPSSPPGFRSGFVALMGRPNVGKSTLMNQLVGQKVAITSPVAQTTRNQLRGILTTPTEQFIFVDTPGIHKPHHQLGKVLVSNAKSAMDAVDVILFVVDSSVPMGGGDRYVAELLSRTQTPVLLGLNKADLSESGPNTEPAAQEGDYDATYYALAAGHGWQPFKFSALTGSHIPELQAALATQLSPGPYYYPPDLMTDQPERFIMGELIREQILHLTREEIPHSVAVVIDQVQEEAKITRVFATIHVERASQKAILIGKHGQMLKEIGSAARLQMQKLIMGKIYLELFVKVSSHWRQSRTQLSEFGYRMD